MLAFMFPVNAYANTVGLSITDGDPWGFSRAYDILALLGLIALVDTVICYVKRCIHNKEKDL